MIALIFGADGQDGYYLQQVCVANNITVTGVGLSNVNNCIIGDVSDYMVVQSLVIDFMPDFIFHLAAVSTTRHEALFKNHAAITTGTLNILEAVRTYRPSCRVFLTGSGLQFVNNDSPISEKDPFDASSAYAVSRIQSVYCARYYRRLGIKAYIGYLFHHESPLRKTSHVSMSIVQHCKRIAMGSNDRLLLRDVSVKKELGFAGDIAEGIFTLVNQDLVYEAVIGTGLPYSIEDWLDVCFKKIGRDWHEYVDLDPTGYKPEYRLLVSEPATIRSLGWRHMIEIDDLAEIMLS